ncbi:phage minor structural protein GP20 [Gottschalkia purinilytica]|uniref:Phage minor structural protein GP20 n=1 Tax=Gottschalkia purinilytica TaxID=1503 RepID=A0A0L0WEZ9_GOTPU|nr:phage scaffolding protein [Gottschalkia purinilytica]KNF10063.1 phage minor structural protein GP20 [Gottschalkia purinilytica]
MMHLKELLGKELYSHVVQKLGNKQKIVLISNGDWIPKDKFNSINEERKLLKSELKEKDNELIHLSKEVQRNEDLLREIKILKRLNKKLKEKHKNKIREIKFDNSLNEYIAKSKAKNPELVKKLIKLQYVKLYNQDPLWIEQQVKQLKETDGYLFD